MELTLYTEDYIKAAHFIPDYDGKCRALHGHTWKICVWIRGDEDKREKNGILWDFNNLESLTGRLDHVCLNDVIEASPTAENITLYIYNELRKEYPHLDFRVRVYEGIAGKKSYCQTGDF